LKLIEGDIIELSEGQVKILTKEDDFEKYSIHDLVFPLPGSDVQYPNNEFGEECYSELLNKDGIKLTDFDHHHK
jgi:tRNA pseudouridine13 synthase